MIPVAAQDKIDAGTSMGMLNGTEGGGGVDDPLMSSPAETRPNSSAIMRPQVMTFIY